MVPGPEAIQYYIYYLGNRLQYRLTIADMTNGDRQYIADVKNSKPAEALMKLPIYRLNPLNS